MVLMLEQLRWFFTRKLKEGSEMPNCGIELRISMKSNVNADIDEKGNLKK